MATEPGPGPAGGRYRTVEVLGRGGLGAVYRAVDQETGRQVALKVMRAPPGYEEKGAERFRREARVQAKLRHPHLIEVFDARLEGPDPWMVLELVEGRTLRQLVRDEGPRPAGEVVRLGCEIAGAVAVLHEAGVLHRDLKPQNVMVRDRDRSAVVMDLGLAHVEGATVLTGTGELVGTPVYLPPDVLRGGEWTRAGDVYGIGAILFELVTGRRRVPGTSVKEMLDNVLAGRFAEIGGEEGVPSSLAAVIRTALATDPRRRPQDARALLGELERVAGELEDGGGTGGQASFPVGSVGAAGAGSGETVRGDATVAMAPGGGHGDPAPRSVGSSGAEGAGPRTRRFGWLALGAVCVWMGLGAPGFSRVPGRDGGGSRLDPLVVPPRWGPGGGLVLDLRERGRLVVPGREGSSGSQAVGPGPVVVPASQVEGATFLEIVGEEGGQGRVELDPKALALATLAYLGSALDGEDSREVLREVAMGGGEMPGFEIEREAWEILSVRFDEAFEALPDGPPRIRFWNAFQRLRLLVVGLVWRGRPAGGSGPAPGRMGALWSRPVGEPRGAPKPEDAMELRPMDGAEPWRGHPGERHLGLVVPSSARLLLLTRSVDFATRVRVRWPEGRPRGLVEVCALRFPAEVVLRMAPVEGGAWFPEFHLPLPGGGGPDDPSFRGVVSLRIPLGMEPPPGAEVEVVLEPIVEPLEEAVHIFWIRAG